MENYTNPEQGGQEQNQQDLINASLIFARALGLIFRDDEGIVVDINGDVKLGEGVTKVIVFKQNNRIFTLESHIAKQLLEQDLSVIEDESIKKNFKINTQTWVSDQNELIWMPLHSTLDQVLRATQGRNIAGVWLSKTEKSVPHSILPKRHLIELITKIGE